MGQTQMPNNNNGVFQANAMMTTATANGVPTSYSQQTPVTPTSNVTVTTTAVMTQPPTNSQVMAHSGMLSSQMQQMQVFQQPIHAPAYLQQIYNPQQQLFMSAAGNISLQPTGMSPQMQITPQMLAAGKPILQGQSNYIPNSTNQTFVLFSQPPLMQTQQHSKGVNDVDKMKPYVMGQANILQQKSPILPQTQTGTAGTSTATVLNASQFKQMSQMSQGNATIVSTPQLVTTQAGMMGNQQLLNPFQTIGPFHGGVSWATLGGIQSPNLLAGQNPIFIRGQHQEMFLQSPSHQGQPAIQPSPGVQIIRPKQVCPAVSVPTQTTVTSSLVQATQLLSQVKHRSKANAHRTAHVSTETSNQNKMQLPIVHPAISSQIKKSSTEESEQITQITQKARVESQTAVTNIPTAVVNKLIVPEEPIPVEKMEVAEDPTSRSQLETLLAQPQLLPKPIAQKPEKDLACGAPPTTTTTLASTPVISTPTTTTMAAISPIQCGKTKQPQAIVKPNMLTHVIEGYVIQEGPEPFPVDQSMLFTQYPPARPQQRPKKIEESPAENTEKLGTELAKCEFCGRIDDKNKFKRSKRFCSMSCAKRYNVGCSKRYNDLEKKHHGMKLRKQNEDKNSTKDETTDSHSDADSLLLPATPTRQENMEVDNPQTELPQLPTEKTLPKSPINWTVLDVYEFIKALPGCTDYADEFRTQEIDGQAFLLLKEDHLMTAMNMKLGPALKMCACINSLKETNRH